MSHSPLSQPIANLMRTTFSVPLEDTLIVASAKLRENGAEILAVTDGPFLKGIVTERSLARALANGARETEGVEVALESQEPAIYLYQTGAEAIRRFEEYGTGALIVIDDERRVLGLLRASDLISPPAIRTRLSSVGGMATPFGVYLTTGNVRAGASDLALVTTGMLLFFVLTTSTIISVYAGDWLAHLRLPTTWVDFLTGVIQFGLFAVGFRVLPISGIHAAEHMVVHAIERGEPLIPSVVARMPRVHPRCGTNLATAVALFLGIAGASVLIENEQLRLLLALAATVLFWRPLGSLVQYWVTTKKPTAKHIQMGIRSAEDLLARQSHAHRVRVSVLGRIWNSGMLHVMAGSLLCMGLLTAIASLLSVKLPI